MANWDTFKDNDYNNYNDYKDYNDYNDYSDYNDYRDRDLDLDLDWEWISELVTQLTITDKLRNLFMTLRSSDYNQIVTWTAFAIIAMFYYVCLIICQRRNISTLLNIWWFTPSKSHIFWMAIIQAGHQDRLDYLHAPNTILTWWTIQTDLTTSNYKYILHILHSLYSLH